MKKILFLLLAVFFLSASAAAGDFSTLNFIGFSRDGRYLAFEEYGVMDPGGEGYSTIVFVDTLKNRIVGKPISVVRLDKNGADSIESYEPSARKRVRAMAGAIMRKLGIVSGSTGLQVIARPLTDLTDRNAALSEPKSVAFAPNRRERWLNGRFMVNLKATSTDQVCKQDDDPELVKVVDPFDNEIPLEVNPNRKKGNSERQRIYGLELSVRDDDQDKTRVLQKDTKVPLLRGCSIDYRINSVYVYRNYIAVFVGVISPGWAGDNIRMMAVTGKYREDDEIYDAP